MKSNRGCKSGIIVIAQCISAVLAPYASAGGFSSGAVGTTGGQFLELPVSARGVAMGNAICTSAQDATAIYYNPANIADLDRNNIALTHSFYLESISYDSLAVAINTRDHGTIGLGAQYLSVGNIEKTDNTGNPGGGSIAPRDLAISLVNGRKFGNLEFGLGAKYISSRLNSSAGAYAAAGGVRLGLEQLSLAASISNLGSGLKFREEEAPLPATLRIGGSYQFLSSFFDEKVLLVALDGIISKGAALSGGFGLEYESEFSESVKTNLRLGYNSRTGLNGAGGLSGFGVGAGIKFDAFNFDYAFVPFGDLGNSHVISLVLNFGGIKQQVVNPVNRYKAVRNRSAVVPARPEDVLVSSKTVTDDKPVKLKDKPQTQRYSYQSGEIAKVAIPMAIIYLYADTTQVIEHLHSGDEVSVEADMKDWVKVISIDSGKIGWVQQRAIRPLR